MIASNNQLIESWDTEHGVKVERTITSLYIRASTHLRKKFTFMNVKVGSANTTSLHLDQNVVVSNLWKRDSDNAIMLRLGVSGLNRQPMLGL
jgi:hypothetical protein